MVALWGPTSQSNSEPRGGGMPTQNMIICAHPQDAARVMSTYPEVPYLQSSFLREGVLPQPITRVGKRSLHVIEAFLPLSSLQHVCPVTVARAAGTLAELAANRALAPVSISTSSSSTRRGPATARPAGLGRRKWSTNTPCGAKTSLLFGAEEPDVDEAHGGRLKRVSQSMLDAMQARKDATAAPSGQGIWMSDTRLARQLVDNGEDEDVMRDTTTTFAFAGHDTTANLMTWLVFEVCRCPATLPSFEPKWTVPWRSVVVSWVSGPA